MAPKHQNRDELLYWLTPEEADNPNIYLNIYFNGTLLTEALGNLWEWIRIALTEEQSWNKHSPRYLLSIFQESNKLIECTYAIQSNRESDRNPLLNTPECYAPLNDPDGEAISKAILKQDEADNPVRVMGDFYRMNGLQSCRERLWDWLCAAFSKSQLGEYRNAGEELILYKQMERLYVALYLLNRKNWEDYNSKSNSSLG